MFINVLPLSGHNLAVLLDTKLVGKDVGHGKSAFFYTILFQSIYGGLAYRLYRFVACMVF